MPGVQFVVGFIAPFVAAALVVALPRLFSEHAGNRLVEARPFLLLIIVVAAIVCIAIFWGSKRWVSYGLIASIGAAIVMTGLFLAIRPANTSQ